MKKLLSLMLLCMVCMGAWAEIPSVFENGGVITLFNSNSYFAGSQTIATSTEVFKNVFVIEYNEDNSAFYLKRMNDGRYVPKYAGETIAAMTIDKDAAEAFEATVYNETNKEYRLHPVSCESTMYLNSNGQNGTPKYAAGTGAWSFWKVSNKTLDDVKTIAKAEPTTFTQKVSSLFSADALTAIENASTVDDIITAVNNFYASAAGKLFTYSSTQRSGGPWYLNAQGETANLNTTTTVGPQNVFELVYVSGNGYKVKSKKFDTYLNHMNNSAGAIQTVEEASACTYEILTSANDNEIELQFAGTTRGLHLDGGKTPCSWDSGSGANIWTISVVSDEEYAEMLGKTINYTLTDGAGTQYTGSYTGSQGEMPPFTGVTGLTYQSVVWGTDGDNLTLTANITFPFPVSKNGTDNWTYIAGRPSSYYSYWYAEGENVKCSVDKLPTNQTGVNDKYKWAIYPSKENNAFSFKIKNAVSGNFVYTESTSNNHAEGTVTVAENGNSFTYNGGFVVIGTQLLSSPSSSNGVKDLGTNTQHGGTTVSFQTPTDFDALMAKLNQYVIGTGIGKYTTAEDNATKIAAVKAGTQYATAAEFTAMMNACTINQPVAGYYYFKGTASNHYITTPEEGTQLNSTATTPTDASIFQLTEDHHLIPYTRNTHQVKVGDGLILAEEDGLTVEFIGSSTMPGSYNIKVSGSNNYFYDWTTYSTSKVLVNGEQGHTRCQWTIEGANITPSGPTQDEINTLQNQINDTYTKIYTAPGQSKLIGYPDRDSENNQEVLNTFFGYTDNMEGAGVTAENYNIALQTYNQVLALTDINLPEDGKAYKISAVHVNTDGTIADHYYLFSTAEGQITNSATGNSETYCKFIVKRVGDGVVLVNELGNYLCWFDGNDGNKSYSQTGCNDIYSETHNVLTIEHANTTCSNRPASVTGLTDLQRFGLVQMSGLQKDGTTRQYFVSDHTNNDAKHFVSGNAGDKYYGATSHTFLFQFEEVENTNKVKLTNPNPEGTSGLDNKYVGTFSAPYNVELPDGVIAYKASVEGSTVTFNEIGNIVPKNVGVLVYKEGATENVDAVAVPAISTTTVEGNAFVAVVNGTIAEGKYVLGKGSNGVGFYARVTDSDVVKNKAYLEVPAGTTEIRSFRFDFEEQTTGVESLQSEKTTGMAFDLAGRRINANAKGISIVNGKKYIK